jgi:hypothetical protein
VQCSVLQLLLCDGGTAIILQTGEKGLPPPFTAFTFDVSPTIPLEVRKKKTTRKRRPFTFPGLDRNHFAGAMWRDIHDDHLRPRLKFHCSFFAWNSTYHGRYHLFHRFRRVHSAEMPLSATKIHLISASHSIPLLNASTYTR